MSDEENRQQSDTSNNSDHNYESQLNALSSSVNHVEEEPLYAANIDDLVSAAKLGSVNTIDASFQLGDKLLPSGENILTEKNNEIDYEVHVDEKFEESKASEYLLQLKKLQVTFVSSFKFFQITKSIFMKLEGDLKDYAKSFYKPLDSLINLYATFAQELQELLTEKDLIASRPFHDLYSQFGAFIQFEICFCALKIKLGEDFSDSFGSVVQKETENACQTLRQLLTLFRNNAMNVHILLKDVHGTAKKLFDFSKRVELEEEIRLRICSANFNKLIHDMDKVADQIKSEAMVKTLAAMETINYTKKLISVGNLSSIFLCGFLTTAVQCRYRIEDEQDIYGIAYMFTDCLIITDGKGKKVQNCSIFVPFLNIDPKFQYDEAEGSLILSVSYDSATFDLVIYDKPAIYLQNILHKYHLKPGAEGRWIYGTINPGMICGVCNRIIGGIVQQGIQLNDNIFFHNECFDANYNTNLYKSFYCETEPTNISDLNLMKIKKGEIIYCGQKTGKRIKNILDLIGLDLKITQEKGLIPSECMKEINFRYGDYSKKEKNQKLLNPDDYFYKPLKTEIFNKKIQNFLKKNEKKHHSMLKEVENYTELFNAEIDHIVKVFPNLPPIELLDRVKSEQKMKNLRLGYYILRKNFIDGNLPYICLSFVSDIDPLAGTIVEHLKLKFDSQSHFWILADFKFKKLEDMIWFFTVNQFKILFPKIQISLNRTSDYEKLFGHLKKSSKPKSKGTFSLMINNTSYQFQKISSLDNTHSKDAIISLLETCPDGSFILRISTKKDPNFIALTFVHNKKVKNAIINYMPGLRVFLFSTISFPNLEQLVSFFKVNPLSIAVPGIDTVLIDEVKLN